MYGIDLILCLLYIDYDDYGLLNLYTSRGSNNKHKTESI